MENYKSSLIVKYDNQMNNIAFGKLSAVELDLLMCICATVREKGTDVIELQFSKIKQITNYSSTDKKDFIKALDNVNKKLLNLDFKFENDDILVRFVLFTTFKIDKKKETLTIAVNPDFKFILNEIENSFTRYELQEFISVQSKYSKVLYQQLKQWRKTGYMYITIEEFRRILNIPKSYRISEIDKKVLKPALKELKPIFKNLKVKKVKAKSKGQPVEALQFFFQKELGSSAPSTVPADFKKEVAPDDDLILKNINNVPKI